ncbi:MAG: 3-deoxy-7-phosphoheptulonate synthase [Candidatus Thorarchaeota archaeon]|nr:3-deoxy-7-phosphoheptulonate synthase [Candidatus Thorarchaeota archaeon]
MLVVMYKNATEEQIERVLEIVEELGYKPIPNPGASRMVINITGDVDLLDSSRIEGLGGVMKVIRVTKPYRLADIEVKPDPTVIEVGDVEIGGSRRVIIAGPCSVESLDQIVEAALAVKECGGDILRGGAFKPRTSPYSFQGLGGEGLKHLKEARRRSGLPIITEAVDIESFELVEATADIVQIGARNMQNYSLLKRAGRSPKPVMLKRGISATLNELLAAAEYIMSEGNQEVILCERGIRTQNNHVRFTLDLASIPVLRGLTHLPLIIDPSHAAGKRDIVIPLARAGLAVGADGLIIEVHPRPDEALVDGAQSLTIEMFRSFMDSINEDQLLTDARSK